MNAWEKPGIDPADQSNRAGLVLLAATVAILLLSSWVFIHWDLDRVISARFYSPESGWFLAKSEPWLWLYRYGTIPGVVLTVLSLIGAVFSYLRMPNKLWHRHFLLVVLTAVIGAGLLVNTILKPYSGRPRPIQIHEFGGQYPYHHVLSPGTPGKGKSFPSGHSTMGFIFVSLVYFRRKSLSIAWIGGIGALVYGGLISAARVVQGAHFVTDCIWSLGIIWLVATLLYYYVLKIPVPGHKPFRQLTGTQKKAITVVGVLLSVAIAILFLTRRPYYETYEIHSGIPQNGITELRVGLKGGYDNAGVRYSEQDRLRVLIHASGFAWPEANEKLEVVFSQTSGNIYQTLLRMKQQGYFSELGHEIEIVVPFRLKEKLTVIFLDETGRAVIPRG